MQIRRAVVSTVRDASNPRARPCWYVRERRVPRVARVCVMMVAGRSAAGSDAEPVVPSVPLLSSTSLGATALRCTSRSPSHREEIWGLRSSATRVRQAPGRLVRSTVRTLSSARQS